MLGLFPNRKKLLSDPKRLGRWGEKHTEKFLRKKGMHFLARNYSCRAGEIDLIMVAPDRSIVFVEVKTRAAEDFTATEEVITTSKMNKLARTARYFLTAHEIENRPYRFDIVTITLDHSARPKITHYENAFLR